MNGRQGAVLAVGLVIVGVLILFPPWYIDKPGSSGVGRVYRGYHSLASPPCCSPRVDVAREVWPIGAVCLMTLLAFLELKSPAGKSGG